MKQVSQLQPDDFTISQLMGFSAFTESSPTNKGVWLDLFHYIHKNPECHLKGNKLFGTIPNAANFMSKELSSIISPHIGLKQIRTNSILWTFHNYNEAAHPQDIIVWATPAWGAMIDYYEQL